MPRYMVLAPTHGSPNLASVLTPTLTRTPQSWSSRGTIFGSPGTTAIAAPPPAAIKAGVNELASGGKFYSNNAPNVIYPSQYYLTGPQEHAPVSRISDDQMPVPAVRAPNIIVAAPYRQRLGGQRQVVQPQVVQKWLGMRGTNNGN